LYRWHLAGSKEFTAEIAEPAEILGAQPQRHKDTMFFTKILCENFSGSLFHSLKRMLRKKFQKTKAANSLKQKRYSVTVMLLFFEIFF
jgi:hypothetical protein